MKLVCFWSDVIIGNVDVDFSRRMIEVGQLSRMHSELQNFQPLDAEKKTLILDLPLHGIQDFLARRINLD